MKTIYIYTLESDEPIEDYISEKLSDDEIRNFLHTKYGKQGWLTFSFEKHLVLKNIKFI